ncbi:MAG: radical SAM protein [Candidatus Aenigmatarchaeota archaeon]
MYTLRQYKKLLKLGLNLPRKVPNLVISKFYNRSVKVRSRPFFAQIEPTRKCNLRCPMCARNSSFFDKKIGDMSFDNFREIIDKIPQLMIIMLQGLGEPYLNNDFFKMAQYANKKGIIVLTTTNGTLLNYRNIKKTIESGMSSISISIDSVDKNTYEKIRVGSNFESVVNNVKNLVRTRNRMKSDMSIYLTSVLMKDNIKELPKFVEFAHKIGFDCLTFQPIAISGEYPIDFNKPQKIEESDPESYYYISCALERAKEVGLKLQFIYNKTFKPCIWLWEKIYIRWDGYVTPCCSIVNFSTGNILKQNLDEVWNDDIHKNMREKFLRGEIPKICSGCDMTRGFRK